MQQLIGWTDLALPGCSLVSPHFQCDIMDGYIQSTFIAPETAARRPMPSYTIIGSQSGEGGECGVPPRPLNPIGLSGGEKREERRDHQWGLKAERERERRERERQSGKIEGDAET